MSSFGIHYHFFTRNQYLIVNICQICLFFQINLRIGDKGRSSGVRGQVNLSAILSHTVHRIGVSESDQTNLVTGSGL